MTVRNRLQPLLFVVAALLATAAVLGLLLLRKRLGQLVNAAARLRSGDYRTGLRVRGDDSIAALAAELTALSDELARRVSQVEHGREELKA